MSEKKEDLTASAEFVTVFSKYMEVAQLQILGLRQTMKDAVDDVMESITSLSKTTDEKSKEAKAILSKTYFEPDSETQAFVKTIQSSVDALLENLELDLEKSVVDDRLRRFSGQFSKHMEALSEADDDVSKILFKMISSLSAGDRLAQKFDHLNLAIQAFQVSLSYMMIDFPKKFETGEMEKVFGHLLQMTYSQFSMEDEKVLFKKFFPDFVPQKNLKK